MRLSSKRGQRRLSGNSRILRPPMTKGLSRSENIINNGTDCWVGENSEKRGRLSMRREVFLLWGAVFLSGCISISSGERTVTEAPATTPTLGQQLQDLKSDYERGLISEREYNQRRERLLGK